MKERLLLPSLRTMGDIGAAAADAIELYKKETACAARSAQKLQGELDRSEQRVRDQAREIERLRRELETARLFDAPSRLGT